MKKRFTRNEDGSYTDNVSGYSIHVHMTRSEYGFTLWGVLKNEISRYEIQGNLKRCKDYLKEKFKG